MKTITIAIDGIAVIVNKENEMNDAAKDFIRDIYVGKITKWNGK